MIVSLSFFPISDFEKFSELERFRLGLVSWPWNPRCVCRIVSGSLEAETWVKQRSGSGETEKLARWKFRTERGERIYGALLTLIESKTFLKTRWVYWNLIYGIYWSFWSLLEFLKFLVLQERCRWFTETESGGKTELVFFWNLSQVYKCIHSSINSILASFLISGVIVVLTL